jgi:hypothetical protein
VFNTTVPVKYDGDILGVSNQIAAELGLKKWQVIDDKTWWVIHWKERELWLRELMR